LNAHHGRDVVSSIVIFPALTAMRLCKRFLTVVAVSAALSLGCFFVGVVLSYLYAAPTGASVVVVNIAAFLIFFLIGRVKAGVRT